MVLYVELNVNWPENSKVVRAGLEGAGLHAHALCLAKRLETDGVIDRCVLHRVGASDELIDRLVTLGLFDNVGDDSIYVHNWLTRNPSQDAIAAIRASKKEAGAVGNHRRWGHEGEFDDCARCHPSKEETPRSSQGAIAPDSQPVADRSLEVEVEVATEEAAAASERSAVTADQRQSRVREAAQLMAERVAEQRGDKGAGWVHNAAEGKFHDYGPRAYAMLNENPAMTAADLADALEPPKREPVNTSAFISHVDDIEPPWVRSGTPKADEIAEVRQITDALRAENPIFRRGRATTQRETQP